MSLLETIKDKYKNAAPIEYGWYFYESKTPAHRFSYFIKEQFGLVINVTVRDEFEEELVLSFLKDIGDQKQEFFEITSVAKQVMEKPLSDVFDAVLLLPPKFHKIYTELGNEVASKTIVAFPINHSEFSGGETVEEIEVLRRYSVTTLDWKRKTSPKVLMRYENPKTQSKSGKDLKLTNYSTLLHECECLSGVKNGVVEAKNYLNQYVRISSDKSDQYRVENEKTGCAF